MIPFRALAYPAWRRLGLEGRWLTVSLTHGGLEITGESAGRVLIPPDEVVRLRLGYSEGKRRYYAARLWGEGEEAAWLLTPPPDQFHAYGAVMRGFAAQVTALDPGRLEGGTTKAGALLMPVLMGLLSAVAIGIAAALENEPWWGRLLIPAFPLAFLGATVWFTIRCQWPRPVTLEELERQLPP